MDLLDEIHDQLQLAGVIGGAWVGAKGFLPPAPDRVIAVFETSGEEADPDPVGALGDKFDRPSFQVRLRGVAFGYEELRPKAQDVFNTLHDSSVVGYVFIYATNSGPLPLGFDENNRPHLSWNFRTMRKRDAISPLG